ncbi:MAG: alpha-glucan family phosphorylase [Candidatus Kapabacteria bacterium]|jgi:alpha-glucan phosphorylase-like protein|nr:alpha-glucan family phosphorylase [Candidatus Kapabacteria bacterium]
MNPSIFAILEDISKRNMLFVDYTFEKLFACIDKVLWKKSGYNPKIFLELIKDNKLASNITDNKEFDSILNRYESLNHLLKNEKERNIAYFSPEFGFHESFPNYSGGLGILAGDMIKSSVSSSLSVVGIGLLYRKGYFKQQIINNKQKESYSKIRFQDFNLNKVYDKNGLAIEIVINISGRSITIVPYEMQIANTQVYLLSTDHESNGKFRSICDNLYTGDRQLRLYQELILGIAGIRLLGQINLGIDKYHINEGHAVFALWELIFSEMESTGCDFDSALSSIRTKSVFTTHTPVVHGNEEFDILSVREALKFIRPESDVFFERIVELGSDEAVGKDNISLTALGINIATQSNGVSKLHGKTASQIWSKLYKRNKDVNPMISITNGIHINSWLADKFRKLSDKSTESNLSYEKFIQKYDSKEIFEIKQELKKESVNEFRSLLGLNSNNIFFDDLLNQDTLLIGFARRFAPYKRADLIFNDLNELSSILNNSQIPMKIIFSGKAHPKDKDGKKLLNEVLKVINSPDFADSIIFIPDYDIRIGRLLVQAADVWLNTPEKPLEACGTSGMKSALNFGLNLSIDDGWWHEADSDSMGWTIKQNTENLGTARDIYNILQKVLLPAFSSQVFGLDTRWSNMMKNSHINSYTKFSGSRMLNDYNTIYKL